MLRQRRAKEKGYITLKEAAKLSNCTPSYVGELIRAGKIKGEQVYVDVTWVTTPEEVQNYLDNKNSQSINISDLIIKSQKYFKFSLYFVVMMLSVFIMFLQYIFYVSFDRYLSVSQLNKAEFTQTASKSNVFVYE